MEYIVTEVLKESKKGTVQLVHKEGETQLYVRKILRGKHPVYELLKDSRQAYLPQIYEIMMDDDSTTVIEEYIEGKTVDSVDMSEKQFLNTVKELCCVLQYVHEKGIIHRDIKPSNMIVAGDGHIRLIDFDVARIFKESAEQDTTLLGTRGYAPPEQYGFMQTDERADIYALGATLEHFLEHKPYAGRYRKIIRRCKSIDPDKRYQSAQEVWKAFIRKKRSGRYLCMTALAGILVCGLIYIRFSAQFMTQSHDAFLEALQTPGNPHWDGETGIGLWEHVLESGAIDNEEAYHYRIYRRDIKEDIPNPQADDDWEDEGYMSSNIQAEEPFFHVNLSSYLNQNGYYFFAVCAVGDGVHYSDGGYAVSDAFHYTGESAPYLPEPAGLAWNASVDEETSTWQFYASWENLDAYEDADSFNVTVYDKEGNYVFNNIWTKEYIIAVGGSGIRIHTQFLSKAEEEYRFTVQALSSRPNEYRSSPQHDSSEEDYLSPPLSP